MVIVILLVLGVCAGSFINALVWRLHQQKTSKSKNLSVISGRSVCVHCRHTLAWYDLLPVLSWLALKGKCRYCHKPISIQYPVVELLTALVFVASYALWPKVVHLDGQWLLLGTWLVASVGLLALAIYDLKWMLLPNRIIYPTLAVAVAGRLAYIIFYADKPLRAALMWVLSVIIASGLFLGLFIISKGKWIGYGDVRLGLITGTLLAHPYQSLAMIFLASLIGSLVIAPALIAKDKTMASKLPYGPFLIAATAILVVYGDRLVNWYTNFLT